MNKQYSSPEIIPKRFHRLYLVPLSALWLLLLVLAAEFLFRFLGLASPGFGTVHHGVLLKPQPYGRYINEKEHRNLVEFNRLGFHDFDRVPSPQKSARIVAVGDSLLEGGQVAKEELLTTVLEKKFDSEGLSVEVLNASISGMNTAKEYLLWKEFLREEIQFQHLTLFFYEGNDLPENTLELARSLGKEIQPYLAFIGEKGDVQIIQPNYSLIGRWFRSLCRFSALANYVYIKLYQLKQNFAKPRSQGSPASDDVPMEVLWRDSIRRTLGLMERWHSELKASGISFSLVIMPDIAQLSLGGGPTPYQQLFRAELAILVSRLDIPLFVLDFSPVKMNEMFYSFKEGYGHFTPQGHHYVAEQIYPWLKERVKG